MTLCRQIPSGNAISTAPHTNPTAHGTLKLSPKCYGLEVPQYQASFAKFSRSTCRWAPTEWFRVSGSVGSSNVYRFQG